MIPPALSRRRLLQGCALAPLAALPLLQGCSRDGDSLCVDPALLSRGEEEMRRAREYVEVSRVANEQCAGCQFFRAAADGECGDCDILQGPVSRLGHCTSWAARS